MNEYKDINDAYLDILHDIKNTGQIKAKRREVPFLTFTLTNINKNVLFFPFAQRNWPWILRECSDRIFSVTNPGLSYYFSKNWENRIEHSGLYSYHYANRLNGQMKEALSKKIHSRDKIIQVWKKSDYSLKGRQPCTIIMQPIMEHDNKMSLVVYMRNNDMINIFPSDIFIHTTYFKYWCTKYDIEYKNLYWISSIAYYQKKRDKLKFAERLLNQWTTTYQNTNVTTWDKDIIADLEKKEELEQNILKSNSPTIKKFDCFNCLDNLKTDYIREWFKIIMMQVFKKDGDKSAFNAVKKSKWFTEFNLIKDSIKA